MPTRLAQAPCSILTVRDTVLSDPTMVCHKSPSLTMSAILQILLIHISVLRRHQEYLEGSGQGP